MKKFTLLIASLFITIGAMAQTFVEPEVGKFYKIKGENSTHYYEIDFLLSQGNKVIPFEIQSSATRNYESINRFTEKYSKNLSHHYLFSQNDVNQVGSLQLKPLYMLPWTIEEI